MNVAAVLFDWRGTLAHSPPPLWWAERGLQAAGRSPVDQDVHRIQAALREAGALEGIDVSAEVHRRETLAAFGRHGLDDALAAALYALDADPANHPLYPDAAPELRAVKASGVAVAVVSDSAPRALMVGDRASHDGGAADAGITTLILPPPPPDLVPRGLDVVTRLVA